MGKKIIPSQEIVTCDGCGSQCGHGPALEPRKMRSVVTFARCGLDMLGDPACDATKVIDLCDKCAENLDEALKVIFKYSVPDPETIFREGYAAGYNNGGSDTSAFECGSGSKHDSARRRDENDAWEQSETYAAINKEP
jgi:hypothetical protein